MNKKYLTYQLFLLKICPLINKKEFVIEDEDIPKVTEKLDLALDAIADVLKLENKAIDILLKGGSKGWKKISRIK